VDEVPDNLARVLRRIAEQPPIPAGRGSVVGELHRLCCAATQALSASGAGVSVFAEGGVGGVMVASDPVTERIEELQFLLGEGPCLDALGTRLPVLVGDLDGDATTRWPIYSTAVQDDGVRAVFAFPLLVGTAQLGVLDVFRTWPGELTADELAQALTFAEVAVTCLLSGQNAASRTESGSLDEAVAGRAELFQAQGMVMVQLGVTLVEALARMRAHAFAQDRSLIEVARDVVKRLVHFGPDR
jgi:hypothetical protein